MKTFSVRRWREDSDYYFECVCVPLFGVLSVTSTNPASSFKLPIEMFVNGDNGYMSGEEELLTSPPAIPHRANVCMAMVSRQTDRYGNISSPAQGGYTNW